MSGSPQYFVPVTKKISIYSQFFWPITVALIFLKLLLISDITVHIRFSPFDDSLYVSRAYAFLTGNSWGPYDPYVLAKLPGMSLWLVASRWLGIPYLLGINLLYCLAGLLLVSAAERSGFEKKVLLLAYILFLYNPVTFSVGWALVMREALSTVLMIAILGVSLQILVSSKDRLCLGWILCWGLLFAFGQLLREEDSILWAYLILFAAVAIWVRLDPFKQLINFRFAFLLLAIPILLTSLAGYGARSYNHSLYGSPIINDFSEGEFPRLMAALRGIDSSVENRLVMLPQDVIHRLRPLVPDFVPVLDRLPAPGIHTFSCKLHGVCSEWSNGWMPWWVKRASAEAGLTPTLPAAQAYFKSIREQIENLCGSKKLSCRASGQGIIPPMELRWFKAYLQELSRITFMLFYPKVELVTWNAQPVNAASSLAGKYQFVTMTSVAANPPIDHKSTVSALQAESRGTLAFIDAIFISITIFFSTLAIVWRWAMYPGVALTPLYQLCAVFWAYSLLRMLALAYVAVFFGRFEPRIVFSTYTGFAILGILAIWDSIQAHKKFQLIRNKNA